MHHLLYTVAIPAFWLMFWMSGGFLSVGTRLRSAGRRLLDHRQRMAELRLEARRAIPAADPAELAEIERLRARVNVLERIVVDERHAHGLADEIDALRRP